jgi:hypothetical protein
MAQMLPEVEEAVAEIRSAFPANEVEVVPWDDGGAEVTVRGVELGEGYEPRTTFVGFRIDRLYPHSDVYPHFMRPDLRRTNGAPLPNPGMIPDQQWRGQPAVMVSRRSTRWDPNRDTAAGKLHKVLEWVRCQA